MGGGGEGTEIRGTIIYLKNKQRTKDNLSVKLKELDSTQLWFSPSTKLFLDVDLLDAISEHTVSTLVTLLQNFLFQMLAEIDIHKPRWSLCQKTILTILSTDIHCVFILGHILCWALGIHCWSKADLFFLLVKLKSLLMERDINQINVNVQCDKCHKEVLHGLREHLVGGLNLVREIKKSFLEEVMIELSSPN